MTEPSPQYLFRPPNGDRRANVAKGTPHQTQKIGDAAFQWWRLLNELGLPDNTRWETIKTMLARRPCTEAENAATDQDGADYRELEF